MLPGIRNQPWEVAQLPFGFKSLFDDWLAKYGLIVVGYGMGDKSVVRRIEFAAERGNLPLGLIYTSRDDRVPDWVAELHRDYPALHISMLRVDSGEEFFAQLAKELTPNGKNRSPTSEITRAASICLRRVQAIMHAAGQAQKNDEKWYLGPELDTYAKAIATQPGSATARADADVEQWVRQHILLRQDLPTEQELDEATRKLREIIERHGQE